MLQGASEHTKLPMGKHTFLLELLASIHLNLGCETLSILFAAEGGPRLLGQTGKKQYEGQITTLQEHASSLKDNWEPIVLQCLPPGVYVSQELKPLVKHVGSKGSTSQNNYGSSGAFSVACLENAPGCYVSGVF